MKTKKIKRLSRRFFWGFPFSDYIYSDLGTYSYKFYGVQFFGMFFGVFRAEKLRGQHII